MKRYFKNRLLRGLRFRLILLVLVAIIPALLLIIYNSAEQQRLSAMQARESALKLARSSASSHEQLLEGARQLLLALSQLAQLQAGDMADCTPILVTLVSQYPSYLNLGVISPEGKVICSALPLSGASIDVSDRPYYQQTIATQAFTVGEYQASRLVGKPVLTLAHPVLNTRGDLTAIVFAGLDLTWLNEHNARASLATGARLTVVDRRGTVLVDVPDSPGSVGQAMAQSSVRDRMLAESEG